MLRKSKLVFTSERILNKRPKGNRCSPWGTMHLLLYLKILQDFESGELSPDQEVIFPKEVQNEFGTLRSTKSLWGEKRLLSEILNQAISFNAPDCITALFAVYDGWENTRKKLNQLAVQLNVSVFSRLAPTGRNKETQLTNIYDYYKIGLAFLELKPISHYFIKNRTHIIHDKVLDPPMDMNFDNTIISSIFWGTKQNDGFLFKKNGQIIECSLVINGDSIEDTVQTALNEIEIDDEFLSHQLEEEKRNVPFNEWLSSNFEGYFLNEKLLKKPLEVNHMALDMPMVEIRGMENVGIVSLKAEHYRSLIPYTSRNIHSNTAIMNSKSKNRISLIITDEPIVELQETIPQFIVPETLQFCHDYISYMREIYKGKLIGITGSAGKSSTRLMMSHLLKDEGSVWENYSNANLHYPTFSLSMEISNNYDFIVFEGAAAAMNSLGYGNNAYLWRPDVAIITSFGSAHAATGIERNLRVKKQLFYGVKEGGYAVINGDIDPEYLREFIKTAKSLNLTIYMYSIENTGLDCYVKNKKVMKYGTEVTFSLFEKEVSFVLKTDSDGQIQNAMGSLLALECIGFSAEKHAYKFSEYESFERILKPKQQRINGVEITLIDDTHNSSIEATINGINHFASKKKFYTGTKLLVLGEVADLQGQSVMQHKRLEPAINEANADKVILYGEPFKSVELVSRNVVHCETKEDVVQEIKKSITEDSLVFVKGSAGIRFYDVVDMLEKESIKQEGNVR
nr:Mur ligase family protein [Enterococcus hulanensis]